MPAGAGANPPDDHTVVAVQARPQIPRVMPNADGDAVDMGLLVGDVQVPHTHKVRLFPLDLLTQPQFRGDT